MNQNELSLARQLILARDSFSDDISKMYYAQAGVVVSNCMSPDWYSNECCRSITKESTRKDLGLFMTDWSSAQFHMVALGDAVYSLRNSVGWDHFRLKCVNPTPKGKMGRNFDEVYCELVVAKLLKQLGAKIEFIEPAGKKCEDFDLVAHISGISIAVEAKLRLESHKIDFLKTLTNTLESARKQLPTDRPTMIVAYVPHEWLNSDSEESVSKCILRFLRQTSRVNIVALLYEKKAFVANGVVFTRHAAFAVNEEARNPWSATFDIQANLESAWIAVPGSKFQPSFALIA